METNELKFRKYQNNMISCGTGLKLFSLRSVIKLAFFLFLDVDNYIYMYDFFVQSVIVSIVILIQFVDVFFHFYIAICAKQDALGKKNRWAYIFLSLLPIALYVFSAYISLNSLLFMPLKPSEIAGYVIGFAIDITCISLFVIIMVNALYYKYSRKKLGKGY